MNHAAVHVDGGNGDVAAFKERCLCRLKHPLSPLPPIYQDNFCVQLIFFILFLTTPLFLAETVKAYIQSLHAFEPSTRLFEITKCGLSKEMKRVSFRSGVKEIRLHDLRHSHASYLVHRGVPIIAISQRLGHEKIETTLRTYAHLHPQDRDIIIDVIENDPEIKGSIKDHGQ